MNEESQEGLEEQQEQPEEQVEQEEQQEQQPAAPEIDYDKLAAAVAEKMKPAQQQQAPPPVEDEADPFQAVADKLWEDPAAALKEYGQLIRAQTMQAMAPYVAPAAQGYAMQEAMKGLPEGAGQYVQQVVDEMKIDPTLLNDPKVLKLVQGAAKAEFYEKSGRTHQKPVPGTESATTSSPWGHTDPDTAGEMDGLARLAASLGIKNYNPGETLRKVK